MLAFIHFAEWYRGRMKVKIPEKMREMVERESQKQGITVQAEWVEGEVDTLEVKYGNAYDFSQDP
jgi:LDH2 family malate/lactate/ureidoglycolate dehydrogenase